MELINGRAYYDKASGATKTYRFDWRRWLGAAKISSSTVSAAGVNVAAQPDETGVNVTVSGGELGTFGTVTCLVTDNSLPAQTDERTMVFRII